MPTAPPPDLAETEAGAMTAKHEASDLKARIVELEGELRAAAVEPDHQEIAVILKKSDDGIVLGVPGPWGQYLMIIVTIDEVDEEVANVTTFDSKEAAQRQLEAIERLGQPAANPFAGFADAAARKDSEIERLQAENAELQRRLKAQPGLLDVIHSLERAALLGRP